MRLYLPTLNPTASVLEGFLPAAEALGWSVTLLTDQPERYPGHEALRTDVRDPRALIETIARHHRPDVIFTNSDHLQAETALAAEYFGLPGKDWRACVTAKNKALMRRRLAEAGVETVRSVRLTPDAPPPEHLPYPLVVKPAEGVASEDVRLVRTPAELREAVAEIGARRGGTLVAEEYLEGPLRTLETLGDRDTTHVLGGFRTTLGPLPYFVEERLDWDPAADEHTGHLKAALEAVGVGFGACHTEYVCTERGPRIIEINYRVIGDWCDFLLADLLGVPLHQWILRVHAGEPVPEPPAARRHGAAVSLIADRSGVIRQAPGPVDPADGDAVRLWHRPLRAASDQVTLTHTNRDYLGVVWATGAAPAEVDAAINAFRTARPWVIG